MMTRITRDDVQPFVERWRKAQTRLRHEGGFTADLLDVYADAAQVMTMADDAQIPLDELVPDEEERTRLTQNAAHAQLYNS